MPAFYFTQLVSCVLYNTDFDILTIYLGQNSTSLSHSFKWLHSVLGLSAYCMYANVPYFKQTSADGHLSFQNLLLQKCSNKFL